MSIGIRIKKRRAFLRMTQAELARLSGIKQAALWRMESDQNAPGAESLRRLATSLHCSVDWLLGMYEEDVSEPVLMEACDA